MSDDLVRAKEFGVYKKLLVKALNLLITTLVNSVVIDHPEWEAKIALRIVVKDSRLKAKDVRLTVNPLIHTVSLSLDSDITDITENNSVTVRSDLSLMETGMFETVIHNIDDVKI